MSQIQYYGKTPGNLLPHRGGLVAWGVVMIVLGAIAGLFAVLTFVTAIIMAAKILPGSAAQNPSMLFVGCGVYVIASISLIWLGIGSRQGRRWVRPLIIIVATLTVVSGVASLPPMTIGIVSAIRHPIPLPKTAPPLPFNPVLIGLAFGGCFALAVMVVFPISILWFYARSSVQTTLDLLDPNPHWTDRVPLPVLGWSIACILGGLGLASSAIQGVFPCFKVVLVGPPAHVMVAVIALMLIGGGILCYRQHPFGRLITLAAAALLATSFTTFLFLGDHKLYADLILGNMTTDQRRVGEDIAEHADIVPVLTYISAVVYAMAIRKRFGETSVPPSFAVTNSPPEFLTAADEIY